MPVLKNPKHEAFAQAIAEGKPQLEAYIQAGYKASEPHASRLASDGKVATRVAEILHRAAARTEITIASLTEMLLEDRQSARAAGQFAAAVSADEKIGKLYGLFIDRAEIKTTHYVLRAPEPAKTIDGWLEDNRPKQIGKDVQ